MPHQPARTKVTLDIPADVLGTLDAHGYGTRAATIRVLCLALRGLGPQIHDALLSYARRCEGARIEPDPEEAAAILRGADPYELLARRLEQ